MTEAKHTPGPWRWFNDSALVADHGRRPAVLTASPSAGMDSAPEFRQRDARGVLVRLDPKSPDALLIAAAPDLYAACEAALRMLTETGPADGPQPIIATATLLAKALAKSRGIA